MGRVVVQTAEGSPPLRFVAEVTTDDEETWTTIADRWDNDLPGRRGAYTLLFPQTHASKLRLRFPTAAEVALTEVHVHEEPPAWQAARNVVEGPEDPDAPDGNYARGRPTLSSEWEGDNGPWKAVDGKRSWGDGYWAGAVGHPQWWTVDLGAPEEVSRAHLFFYAGDRRGYAWVLQSSLDGVAWHTLVERREPLAATSEGMGFYFATRRARFLRVVVLENTANPAAHLAEFEVYGD